MLGRTHTLAAQGPCVARRCGLLGRMRTAPGTTNPIVQGFLHLLREPALIALDLLSVFVAAHNVLLYATVER